MTWQQALEAPIVQAHPAYKRYCVLCADDYPEPTTRDGYREIVIGLAMNQPVIRMQVQQPQPITVDYGLPAVPFRRCCG